DSTGEYTVPLDWNLFGFFGKGDAPEGMGWKQVWGSKKIALWGEALNILYILSRLGLNIEQRLEEEPDRHTGKTGDDEVRKLSQSDVRFLKPTTQEMTDDAAVEGLEWIEQPVARVARLLTSKPEIHFWLPEDGAIMELGVFAVGDKASQPDLALELVDS